MNPHFRMCASAYRDGETIDATAYAGLPDRRHDGKITRIGDNPDLLEIFIDFTRREGPCPDEMLWTWEEHCVVPYRGQQHVKLIGSFEGKEFSQFGSNSRFRSRSMWPANSSSSRGRSSILLRSAACPSLPEPRSPKAIRRFTRKPNRTRIPKADCEAWREANCG